jgi:hypothetical protein
LARDKKVTPAVPHELLLYSFAEVAKKALKPYSDTAMLRFCIIAQCFSTNKKS